MRTLLSRRWRPYLHSLAERHLIPVQRNYRRFVLLGMARSGSNLLRTALDQHPRIVVYNEVYSPSSGGRIPWAQPGVSTTPEDLRLRDEDPAGFLERRIFRPMWPGVQAVGFKLFYYHVPQQGALWRALEQARELRVVHLKRRNLLEAYASLKLAMRTGAWMQGEKVTNAEPSPTLELEFEPCLDFFTNAARWQREFDRRFPRALEVYYEDLLLDYAKQIRRVQRYIGVTPRELRPATRKQNRRPIEQRIGNYQELRKRFRGTPWEHLFNA